MNYRFCSINVRGLNNNFKRKSIFRHCKKFHIICLQETRIVPGVTKQWEKEWGGKLIYSEGSTHSKGQIILINSNINTESVDVVYNIFWQLR